LIYDVPRSMPSSRAMTRATAQPTSRISASVRSMKRCPVCDGEDRVRRLVKAARDRLRRRDVALQLPVRERDDERSRRRGPP
jgi:hypothetical protein